MSLKDFKEYIAEMIGVKPTEVETPDMEATQPELYGLEELEEEIRRHDGRD